MAGRENQFNSVLPNLMVPVSGKNSSGIGESSYLMPIAGA
jgi:hypothetical protein